MPTRRCHFSARRSSNRRKPRGPLTDAAYLKARDRRPTARRQGRTDRRAGQEQAGRADRPEHGAGMAHRPRASATTSSAPATAWPRWPARRASPCRWATCHGLPIGLAFMGRAYSEAELLGFAYAYEQASKARKAPSSGDPRALTGCGRGDDYPPRPLAPRAQACAAWPARTACARSASRSPATARSSGADPPSSDRRAPDRFRSARARRRGIR